MHASIRYTTVENFRYVEEEAHAQRSTIVDNCVTRMCRCYTKKLSSTPGRKKTPGAYIRTTDIPTVLLSTHSSVSLECRTWIPKPSCTAMLPVSWMRQPSDGSPARGRPLSAQLVGNLRVGLDVSWRGRYRAVSRGGPIGRS